MERRHFLKTTGAVGVVAVAGISPSLAGAPAIFARSRETILFDSEWRFHLGDIVAPLPQGHDATYLSTKAGAAAGAAAPSYKDADWRVLDLPHDFVVEGPFAETENVSQGYRPKGVGWYRKQFHLDPADAGKHIELQFDGIATNATIWVNGNVVRHNWSGYDSAYIDITAFASFGDRLNTIAVRVDSSPFEGWWYEGGGIYRHVWLVKRAPVHLITDGIYAHPRHRSGKDWEIPLEATLENIGAEAVDARVEAILVSPEGRYVALPMTEIRVEPLAQGVARLSIPVTAPHLWSIEDPALYQLLVIVKTDRGDADDYTTAIGFRTQRFDPALGFFLNDKPVKIKGVCIHQDHAGVGVALPDSIIDFRVRRLKEMGCNAIRSSHNAPTRELLDACDRHGLMVMDENRLFNSSPDYMRILEWMVRRDRNHPSIILWSVFNEEPLQGTAQGYEMVRRMAAVVKHLDDTRPVTAAMNNGMYSPVNVSQAVDVVGFNYQIDQYDKYHAAHPEKPLTSSEDTSAVMTRGEYASDRKGRHVLASYDDEAQPWGATHRAAWKAVATRPFVAGAFVWTGFDYRGEPQPFEWPTVTSSFGAMDLCGFPKTAYYIHQAQWITDKPALAIVPHWNWAGREGQPIRVMVMANVEEVALLLNGKLISTQKVDPYEMNQWQVPYAPGRLEAIGRSKGRTVTHAMVETTGAPASLRLTPDRTALAGDGRDAMPVTVEALDAKGRPVPTANLPVEFAITGGRIIGLGNGDANNHDPEKGNRYSLYNGLAQVIVQSDAATPGPLILRASAGGLKPASASVKIAAA